MACCVVQSFCRIAAWFDCWIDHPRRREACLVSEAAVWTLSGVWCANLDVFWQRFFALVFQLGQSITPITPKVGVKRVPLVPISSNCFFQQLRPVFSG